MTRVRALPALCLVLTLCSAAGAAAERHDTTRPTPVQPRTYDPTAPGVQPASAPPPARLDELQDRAGEHHRPTPLGPMPPPGSIGAMASVPPPPASQPRAAGPLAQVNLTDVTTLTDIPTNGDTSTVNEPSVGVRGNEILYTGNWYASFSTDGGATFAYVDPWAEFPSVNGGFCCDQVALYDANHDMMIWFLQYLQDGSTNTIRVAVATGGDIAARNWTYYDFSPPAAGGWNNEWFDYPELALSNGFLYITTNTFSTSNFFTRAVILKISLSELANGQALNYGVFSTTSFGSLRPVHGAQDVMVFAAHGSPAQLRIFEWADASATVITTDVTVTPWPNGARPGWTQRSDPRITGAWQSGNEIGFAWTAGAGSGFAHPHIRVAILDRNTKAVIAQPHIFSANFPYAYPAAARNADGDVGMAFHFGANPSHAVATLDGSGANRSWDIVTTVLGTDSPNDNKWGDYGAVRPDPLRSDGFVATGYTLQGGGARTDIEPLLVRFNTDVGPAPPTQPLVLAMTVTDASDALGQGDRRSVTVTASRGGAPAGGETVQFSSLDARLSVDPASGVTDAGGVTTFDVINNSSDRASIQIKAESGGTEAFATVRIPSLAPLAALLALGLVAALSLTLGRRR